jgi:A/G-specific adenine glycosylase
MPSVKAFQKIIKDYYSKQGRIFPWRETRNPYKILVSEIMLQQTQAPRVVEKYRSFIKRFPSVANLASAKTIDVLQEWQGLGYNRRGLALKKAAEIIMKEYHGKVPNSLENLLLLPGVGPATAGDILAFAWNQPSIVIETNIRSVFIHFFFKDTTNIADSEILPLIQKTLDRKNPREWYFALMDYGAFLKKNHLNPSRRSKQYSPQSPFSGSNRELRSKILRYIIAYSKQPLENIVESLQADKESIEKNLRALVKEGLLLKQIYRKKEYFSIPS